MEFLSAVKDQKIKKPTIDPDITLLSPAIAAELVTIIQSNEGQVELEVRVTDPSEGCSVLLTAPSHHVVLSADLFHFLDHNAGFSYAVS